MADVFQFIFRYAWFLFGLYMLAQLLFVPARATKLAASTGDDPEQVRRFLNAFWIFVALPYFALGALQFAGGFETVFYVFFGPLSNPYIQLAIGVLVSWWAAGAFFLFVHGGAETLVHYQMVRGIGAGNPTFLKLAYLALVVFLTIVLLFFRAAIPERF